ncbi:MAG: TMEM165/GDT1 family protein [Actinobacteria bacterium]|nr:TMEM165/GDT1 family protein [Actinomycetota bacterium]MBV9255016.1 TMEM165/GDT1 family protein [Actinomycetota bacterium]
MHLGAAAATFIVIFPAELPDKTLIATLIMGTRYRPLAVWSGAAAAFAVHVAVAATVGGVFALLPKRLVQGVVAGVLAVGAGILLFRAEKEDEKAGEELAAKGPPSNRRVAASAFALIFAAEWGDISQVLTANLAARYHDPLSVALGSVTALWLAAGVAVLAGRSLVKRVPLEMVRRVAGAVLLVFAVLSAVEAIRG